MKNLSFDPEAIEKAHDFWRWRIEDKLAQPGQGFSEGRLMDEMRRRGMSFMDGLKKEVPRPLAHGLILAHYPDAKLDPSDPELSNYEAARVGNVAASSVHTAAVIDARHLLAYSSGEYSSLLDAADQLKLAPHQNFVRGEILATMGQHEIMPNLGVRSRAPLDYDVKGMFHGAIDAYRKAVLDGVPCADEITHSYLGLIDLGASEVPALIEWVKHTVNQQLTPDKSSPVGAVEALFCRDVHVVEGLELMEWLIEHGVPIAGRSFINGFWAEASSSFCDPRISPREINANVQRLFARAKELEPRIDQENYDEAKLWVLN